MIRNGPQDKMPSELHIEGEGHRVLPSSDDPQPMTPSSFCSTLTKPSERESSDSKEPQSEPARFSFSFSLACLHTSMRDTALLTSLESTSGSWTACSTTSMSKVRIMPVTKPASGPDSFSTRG